MSEQVVLITGATGALGQSATRVFAQAGYRLALTGRDEKALAALADAVELPDGRVTIFTAELTAPDRAEALVQHTLSELERIDALLHIAGGWRGGVPLVEMTDADWDAMLDMNLRTAFNVSRAALPTMIERGYGRVVYVGSRAVEHPSKGQAHYNVSKTALVALARSIAADYGGLGIRCNVVMPATIDTPRNRQRASEAERSDWVQPDAIAQTMLLLCESAGAFINGAAIPMYGE